MFIYVACLAPNLIESSSILNCMCIIGLLYKVQWRSLCMVRTLHPKSSTDELSIAIFSFHDLSNAIPIFKRSAYVYTVVATRREFNIQLDVNLREKG